MNPITKLKALLGQAPASAYDREKLRPVILESICTGEQTAGFKEIASGRFHAVMLIRSASDLTEFCKNYGISPDEVVTEY